MVKMIHSCFRSADTTGGKFAWAIVTHASIAAGLPGVSGRADAHVGADEVLAGHSPAGAVIDAVFTLVLV